MKTPFKILLATAALSVSSQAWSWGGLGHEIVGAVAEERMEPATKDFVRGVLGIEPAAFAATWADAVRDDERFGHDEHEYNQDKKDADDHNFSDYHFVDVPTGFTYDTRPNKDLKDAYGALRGSIEILKDTSGHSTRPEKIIALRYLIHVMGDIHQPLHVGNAHDIGANFCYVNWRKETSPMSLHAVWDGNLVSEVGYALKDPSNPKAPAPRYYPEFMAAFKKLRSSELYAAKPKDASLTAIKSWIDESANIRDNKVLAGDAATTVRDIGVYPEKPDALNAFPGTEYAHRPYCMWFSDTRKNLYGSTSPKSKNDIPASAIPRLDDAYIGTNVKVVERQLIMAGIRLAAVLDDIAEDVARSNRPGRPVTDAEQEAALKTVQSLFHNPVTTK